jgi:transglutaminase-like putative cysteine protease
MSTMALLQDISAGINSEFTYIRRQEKGVQAPDETLRNRSGSCRDFAVFMMEAVRSLGVVARFVSGYIFSPADAAIVGAGATHAWAQVYLPGAGWIDFDPTNRIAGNRNLIRVAVAWDPRQALPLWASFLGASTAALGMDVNVTVTDAALAVK